MSKTFQIALYKVAFAKQMQKLEAELAKFAESFSKNAYDALRWGDKVFELAAEKEMALRLNEWIKQLEEKGATELAEDFFIEELTTRLLNWARYLSRSTSPCSNLAEEALMKQHSRMLDGALGCPVFDAIREAQFQEEWNKRQELMKVSNFRIAHKSGRKWRNENAKWTKDKNLAVEFNYETMKSLTLDETEERWEMIEAPAKEPKQTANKEAAPVYEA